MVSLDFAISCALALTFIGLIAGCIRMYLGPTAADRVVCLDFLTVLLVALTSLLALQLDNSAYLDLGLALALVGFLATVALARYLETNKVPPLDAVETGDTDKITSNTDTQHSSGKSGGGMP